MNRFVLAAIILSAMLGFGLLWIWLLSVSMMLALSCLIIMIFYAALVEIVGNEQKRTKKPNK